MLKLFAFAFKFTAKKLGGAVGRLMDYSIGRRQMSSVLCFTVYQTIYRINHLFQNGRALLKCRIFILLQLVIPTLKSHAATRQLRHVRAHCEQTFQDGPRIFSSLFVAFRFRASCVVVELHSSHSFANFTANCCSFSCVLRKFDRF